MNADLTPAELAAWQAEDLASAKAWAVEVLDRAARIRDIEVTQHLGNLLAGLDAARSALRNLVDSFDGSHPTVSTPSALREACTTLGTKD